MNEEVIRKEQEKKDEKKFMTDCGSLVFKVEEREQSQVILSKTKVVPKHSIKN